MNQLITQGSLRTNLRQSGPAEGIKQEKCIQYISIDGQEDSSGTILAFYANKVIMTNLTNENFLKGQFFSLVFSLVLVSKLQAYVLLCDSDY